jgi:hypothetical protein
MTLPLVVIAVAIVAYAIVAVVRASGAAPLENTPDFQNDSGRIHESLAAQTWAAFLRETYRKQKNSGAPLKVSLNRSAGRGVVY